MRKELFDALKAKFPGVNANVLNRIADKLAKTVTTAEQVTTAVAGVTQEIIDIIESYGDSRATEAQHTAVQNYEQKYGLKDGVKLENGGGTGGEHSTETEQNKGAGEGAEQVPAWAKTLIDTNKALSERIAKMETERMTSTRKQQLNEVIGKLPENLRKAYERTPVDNITDDEFNTLIGDITKEVDGIVKSTAQRGAVFGRPSATGNQGNQDGTLTKEQEAAIAHRDSKPTSDGQPF